MFWSNQFKTAIFAPLLKKDTSVILGRFRSGQTGQTVNLLVYTFAGSNPALPTHISGNSSIGRATAFQAVGCGFEARFPLTFSRCSSGVECFLGKEEVTGSNPVIGSPSYASRHTNFCHPSSPSSSLSQQKARTSSLTWQYPLFRTTYLLYICGSKQLHSPRSTLILPYV